MRILNNLERIIANHSVPANYCYVGHCNIIMIKTDCCKRNRYARFCEMDSNYLIQCKKGKGCKKHD